MDLVLLERHLDPPIRLDDVHAMGQQAAWCMDQYRVRHVTSLLSHDGQRLTCTFLAPDAEAVRAVLRQVDGAFERVWPASVHAPADFDENARLEVPDERTLVVVERRFPEGIEFAALQEIEDRGAWCLAQHRVRFLRSYFARDRRDMICIYAAPDAESVRSAQRQAGVPFATAWPALVYDTRC
jgi:hypothetical protein